MLFQCFNALKLYGKEPEQLADIVAMFQRVLAGYSFSQVQLGFDKYLARHTEMPAPADIVNLIDPLPEPLSAAMYISLQKRVHQGEYLMRDERAFCDAFRGQEMAKVRGGSETLTEANREIESWKTLQITHEY